MRARTVRALATLLLATFAAGACSSAGGAGGGLTLANVIAAASKKTTDAKTARVFMVTSITGPQTFRVEADGRMAIGASRGVINVDMASLGLPAGSGKVEMRIIGTIAYMRVPPALAKEVPAGKKWLKIDYAELGKQAGVDLSSLQRNFQTGDPAAVLGFLKGAGSVSKAGSETIRGTKTTHYKATISFDKVVAQADPSVRDEVRKATELLGVKTMPMDVWIAADGLLRRLTFTADLSKLGKPNISGGLTLKMELYDFGVDVGDVVAPPDAEVVDLKSLLGS